MNDPAILGRQIELLYRNTPVSQAISVVNASLLAWLWHGSVGAGLAAGWWLAAVAMALLRFLMALAYRNRGRAAGAEAAPRWLRSLRLGAGGAGFVWAAGAVLFMLRGDPVQEIFTAFVMAGMVAGAVPVLAADRLAFRLYAWPIVLATAVAALGLDTLHGAFSLMAILFLLGSTRGADHFNRTLLESLRLEHEKDALVANVERARQMAERSNRAKTEFLANVSHELRTPLNGVIGMAELLGMEDLAPGQRELLQPLRESADELRVLIENLIELSALEAGHLHLHQSPFAPADLLPTLLADAERKARAKGLEFHLEVAGNLPAVLIGDAGELGKILIHLADNAVKFTRQGQVRIAATLSERQAGNAIVEFTVSDTGPGIASEKLDTIFDSFTQADGSATRLHAGTGIGLPICRKLTELMAGTLEVESTSGSGSTFRLSLPFQLSAD